MTGREKIAAAFSAEGSPAPAAVIPYEGILVRDHWGELTSCPWWFQHARDLVRQLRWRREAIRATGQDWFTLPPGPSREESTHVSIEAGADSVCRVDDRTGERRRLEEPVISGWPHERRLASVRPDRPPTSPEEIDEALGPTPSFDAERFVAEGRHELAAALLREFGDVLYPMSAVGAPLWCCYNLLGFEAMMLFARERPELLGHACEQLLQRSLAHAARAKTLGCEGLWIEDCMTDMISPAAFRDLNVPYLQRLTAEMRALGLKSIYYYCGNPWDRWDDIMSCGADAIALEEGKKGFSIDIEDVADAVGGQKVVLGNLDAVAVLQDGSEDELRRHIARQLAAGRRNGGRFVMSLGSPVTPGTPVARVRLYCELTRELGERGGRR